MHSLFLFAFLVSAPDVQIGLCTSTNLPRAKQAGFAYAELVVRSFATLTNDAFAAFKAEVKASGLPTPVANSFLPTDLKISGPVIDKEKQNAYVKTAFDRAKELGIRIIVLGSGGARNVPDGFPKADAFAQLVEFAKRIAPEAKKRNIVVTVEPLRQQESNIMNSGAEGLTWVKAVGHPNFQLMIDFYHLASEGESPDIVLTARKSLRHIHIANPSGRVFPMDEKEAGYGAFFRNLKKIGFRGGISVEGNTKEPEVDGPKTAAFLRTAYDQAGQGQKKGAPVPPAK